MKPPIANLVAGVLLSLALFGVAAAGPLEDGRAAYERSDYAAALRLLRPLAEQGSAEAQLRLGWMSQFGQTGTLDEEQAVAWYGRAADQGLREAQYNLAFMLEGGYGVTKDEAQARKLYRKAADQGHAMSQLIVANFYVTGQDGTRDDLRAYMWFELASRAPDAALRDLVGASVATIRENAANRRDDVAARLTAAQIAEAKRLASEWKAQ